MEAGVPYHKNSVMQERRWDHPSALNFEQLIDPSLTDQENEHVTITLQGASLVIDKAAVGPK